MSGILIVPVLSPAGSTHFASVSHDATVEHVIASIIVQDDFVSDVLGGTPDHGWDIQIIRSERAGHPCEESELEALGDGEGC